MSEHPTDVERQLEGRAERLAEAQRSYAELEKVLSGWSWRRAWTRRPEGFQSLVSGAEALAEALARVHRRAELEAWPDRTPVLRLAHDVDARRERLIGLAHRRLEALGLEPGNASLEALLTRLDGVARQAWGWELGQGEVLVFETPARWLRLGETAGSLSRASWWERMMRSGRLRLTNERLIWRSTVLGDLQVVRLDGGAAFRFDSGQNELHMGDLWAVHIRSAEAAAEAAGLVELLCWAPLREALRSGKRSESTSMAHFPAKHGLKEGHCVLSRERVSFTEADSGPFALHAITGGSGYHPRFRVDRIFDLLRWLPEAEFKEALRRVLDAGGSRIWNRAQVVHLQDEPSGSRNGASGALLLECGEDDLTGYPEGAEREVAERLLRAHYSQRPRRSLPS
jgi:hypothetical protein